VEKVVHQQFFLRNFTGWWERVNGVSRTVFNSRNSLNIVGWNEPAVSLKTKVNFVLKFKLKKFIFIPREIKLLPDSNNLYA
jgi:hypothetical protein